MADSGSIWKVNFKINTDERGFQFKCWINNASEDIARAAAVELGERYKALLPPTAEIFYAQMSKLGPDRDGLYLPEAVGLGSYDSDAVAAGVQGDYDFSRTCLNLRLETPGRKWVTRKFGPIPDEIITGGKMTDLMTAITVPQTEAPATAPGAAADYKTELSNFVKALMFYTCYKAVKPDGEGAVVTDTWKRGMLLRVGSKKGGRVFIG